MNCDAAMHHVEPYADGELRGPRRLLMSLHLRRCPACLARGHEVLALRVRIRAECPRFSAPARLRERVLVRAEAATQARASAAGDVRPWPWATSGAVAGALGTILVWMVSSAMLDRRSNQDLAVALVNAHVRATLQGRLAQVESSDQHTVKPWLSAHLDYAPPVRDLTPAGYPLAGARVERIDGQPVATLVYRYRLHVVDVFVRPEWLRGSELDRKTVRGFNVVEARGHGMDWILVSDASVEGLEPLARELTRDDGRP